MFGILRLSFSLTVVTFHLIGHELFIGTYAVFGFYIISGYLMTVILHGSYDYSASGRKKFAINRALRLYPQYWAAGLLTILLIYIIGPSTVERFKAPMFIPETLGGWLTNLTMIFPAWNPSSVLPRLVPPSWNLSVEIFFYILLAFGISKTFGRVKVWLVLSVVYVIGSFVIGAPLGDRYAPVPAASLPFALGAAIYFLAQDEGLYARFVKLRISSGFLYIVWLVHLLVEFYLYGKLTGFLAEVGVYINLSLCGLLVYSIIKGSEIMRLSKTLDKWLADFSYPLYLLHWQMSLLVSYTLYGKPFHNATAKGLISYGVSLVVGFLFSTAFILLIDRPIEKLRNKIRTSKSKLSLS